MNWNVVDKVAAWVSMALCITFLVIFLKGCAYNNYDKSIIYNEHQGMEFCKSDSTWYNENLVDLVCKD